MPPLAALLLQMAAEFRRDAPGHTVLVEWLVRTALLHVVRAHLAAAPSASPASANWWKTPTTKNCSQCLTLLQCFPGHQGVLDAISPLQLTSATRWPQETISCCTAALHEYRLLNGRFLTFDACRERQLFICSNGSNGHRCDCRLPRLIAGMQPVEFRFLEAAGRQSVFGARRSHKGDPNRMTGKTSTSAI